MQLSACVHHYQNLGLQSRGRFVYGILSDYPLYIQLQGYGNSVGSIIYRIQLQDTLNKKVRKELKILLKKRCTISLTGHTLTITVHLNKENSLDETDALLNTAIEFLKSHGISASENCPVCGQPHCDSAVFYKGAYQKVHASCIHATLENVFQKVDNNQINGSYFLGLLGALLGGIVGILPSILTILFLETIYALLYALIPICIYWGYRLFHGIINKFAIVLTIVLSIFFLFFMEFILLNLSVYNTYGLILIRECFELFITPEGFKEIVSQMRTSFVFLVIGLIYSWKMISETNTGIHTNAEFTLSTVIPLVQNVSTEPTEDSNVNTPDDSNAL